MQQFREGLYGADILLVDDIQFLGGRNRDAYQEEFFHIFNTFHDAKRQIVISSDRQSSELKNIPDRLTNRFQWGFVAEVQAPDEALRFAIIKKETEYINCHVPDDVIHFLSQNVQTNVRDLEGALKRIVMTSEISHEPLTVENAAKWLK